MSLGSGTLQPKIQALAFCGGWMERTWYWRCQDFEAPIPQSLRRYQLKGSKWVSMPLTLCMLCVQTGIWTVENVASWWGRKSAAPRVIHRRFGRCCWYYWYCSALVLRTSKIVANHYIIEQKPYCVGSHDLLTSPLWSWSIIKQFMWWWQTAGLRNWCTMPAMPRFGYGQPWTMPMRSKRRPCKSIDCIGPYHVLNLFTVSNDWNPALV